MILLQQNLYKCQDLPSVVFLISDTLAFQKGDNLKIVLFPELCWFWVIKSLVPLLPSQWRTSFVFSYLLEQVWSNKDIVAKPRFNFVSQQFPRTHGALSKSFILYLAALPGQDRLICKSLSNIMIQFGFLPMDWEPHESPEWAWLIYWLCFGFVEIWNFEKYLVVSWYGNGTLCRRFFISQPAYVHDHLSPPTIALFAAYKYWEHALFWTLYYLS